MRGTYRCIFEPKTLVCRTSAKPSRKYEQIDKPRYHLKTGWQAAFRADSY